MTRRVDEILATVAAEEGLALPVLLGATRGAPPVAKARQRAMREVHKAFPTMSWTDLGKVFKRDRTTVRYACEGRRVSTPSL